MNPTTITQTKTWTLLVGPSHTNCRMMAAVAQLAKSGLVNVVDCGLQYDRYLIWKEMRGNAGLRKLITLLPAYTCHQVLEVLEAIPNGPTPLVVLDLLKPFYLTSTASEERKRVLRSCLDEIKRITNVKGGLVSVHPPQVLCQAEEELLGMLLQAAEESCLVPVESAARMGVRA